jgi:hypothetical protein
MNGDNSWIPWLIFGGFFVYWLTVTQATSAANLNQVGVPAGTKVSGQYVLNAQGQTIGTITSAGYYMPYAGAAANPLTATSTGAAANPLTGANVTSGQ